MVVYFCRITECPPFGVDPVANETVGHAFSFSFNKSETYAACPMLLSTNITQTTSGVVVGNDGIVTKSVE
jgi:hypothetical protein